MVTAEFMNSGNWNFGTYTIIFAEVTKLQSKLPLEMACGHITIHTYSFNRLKVLYVDHAIYKFTTL